MALSFAALQQGVNPVVAPDKTKSVRALAEAQSMQQSSELRGLQIEGARGELDAQKQAQERASKVFDILTASQGQVTPEVINAIRPIDREFATALEKSESDKANVTADNKRADDAAYNAERKNLFDRFRQQEVDARAMDEAKNKTTLIPAGTGVLRPGETTPSYTQPFAPKTPENLTMEEKIADDWLKRPENKGKDKFDFARLVEQDKARIARENRVDPEQVINYVDESGKPALGILNKRTNQIEPVQTPGGNTAKPVVSSANKPSTGVEKRVLTFYIRAKDADDNVKPMESDIQKLNLGGQTWMQVMPNILQTDLGQRYRQSQRAFTEARLRKDSGAAIPPHEYDNDAQTYFAVPGDSAATLEQKRKGRNAVMEGLKQESGRAYGEHYGTENTGAGAVEEYERGPDGKLRLKK